MNGKITVDADRDLVLVSNNTNLETTVLRDFPGDTGGIHGLMQGVHHRVDVGFFFSMMFALRQAPTKLLTSLGLMSELNPDAMVATHLIPMPCRLPDHFFLLLHALGHGKQDGLPYGIDGLLVDVILVVHTASILHSLLSAATRERQCSPGSFGFILAYTWVSNTGVPLWAGIICGEGRDPLHS